MEGLHDYGLLITPEIIPYINWWYDRENDTVPKELHDVTFEIFADYAKTPDNGIIPDTYFDRYSAYEALRQVCDDIEYLSCFSGSADTWIEDEAEDGFGTWDFDDDVIMYLPLQREARFTKAVYSGVHEMISEVRQIFDENGILPGNFNYRPLIVEIGGEFDGYRE